MTFLHWSVCRISYFTENLIFHVCSYFISVWMISALAVLLTFSTHVNVCDLIKQAVFFQYLFRALKDAEKAIKLSKDWPKGYFRKGRALAGLNVSQCVFCLSVCCFSLHLCVCFSHSSSLFNTTSPTPHPHPHPKWTQKTSEPLPSYTEP